jgi:hypothetical protein
VQPGEESSDNFQGGGDSMASSFLSPSFVIGHIRIGTVEGASCVNMGNNFPVGFRSHKKHNQGFGSVEGDRNSISGTRAVLDDADFIDMLNDSDFEIPEWIKAMVQEQAKAAANG